MVKEEEEEEN